ncbi:hypothetical protein PGT21_018958 [Puccinia graminis f. sp. tritici]|uniref:Uncharacterized protein n=1 Tax=Puccinia graminis f. sp. tritici TaxID=56615 RepID=A0A5B0QIN1_PUCGR|nr:hypothetical protein PGT21_018958 [Puccinia graminis f. sp. tritici]KAA1135851.1 hypothetical protein PGTUg99_029865 [Puccinia graminis f. sp. tritici]
MTSCVEIDRNRMIGRFLAGAGQLDGWVDGPVGGGILIRKQAPLPTIIQFVENVTKTTHLLIIIYLALFKEHQAAGEEAVLRVEESEKILRFIGQLWQDIADNSPGLPQTKWTAKLSELFQFQNKRSRAASVMTNRKKPMYILCCHLLHYWIDKNGKAFKNCKNIDKYNGTLVELINKLVFYSNYHSILAHTFNKNKKR